MIKKRDNCGTGTEFNRLVVSHCGQFYLRPHCQLAVNCHGR